MWDKATLALVRSEVINITKANTAITKQINPILLDKDREYIITIYTDDYYWHHKYDDSDISYPIIAGNIQILGTRSTFGELCPKAGGNTNGYVGDIDFTFQRTE